METEKNLTTIYIARHGETGDNILDILAGHTDSALSPQGEKQARALGEALKNIHFDQVFSSDLIRAKRTAELVILDRKLIVNTTEILRERNFGEKEGYSAKKFREENEDLFEHVKTLSEEEKRSFKMYPTYETDTEISERFIVFLREIAATYPGQTILVVSHGGMMRSLLMRIGYGSFDELPAGVIENTGYIRLESDRVDFFVRETKGVNKAKFRELA